MDFRFKGARHGNLMPVVVRKDVKSGTTSSITPGDIFRADDGNAGYVKLGANGDTSTLAPEVFLAISTSTETASADGYVFGLFMKEMVLLGTATTPANLIQAVIDTKVTLDVSAGTQTIDENDTTTGFMRILRPQTGVAGFDTTNGRDVEVLVNE